VPIQVAHERGKSMVDEKKEDKKEDEVKVEPIHPSEQRGGKKKSLLDTCK
jgi:hypothetical protein